MPLYSKKILLASSTKSTSVGTQNCSNLWNLLSFLLAALPTTGLGVQHQSPGTRPASPMAACLATGHILCFDASLGTKDLQPHNLYFSKSPPDNILERGSQDLLSPLQEKLTFPDFSSLFAAKHNTLAKAQQPSSVYPRIPQGQRNCETLRDAKFPPVIWLPWKCKCIHHTPAATLALFTSPTWEQYFTAVQFKSRVFLLILKPQTLAGPGATPQHSRTEIQSLKRPRL